MSIHANLTGLDIHESYRWTYVDETERLAATGFVATDVKKLAYQSSNGSTWVLKNHNPITWVNIAIDSIPTDHGTSHLSDGSDPIENVTTSISGLMSPEDKIILDQLNPACIVTVAKSGAQFTSVKTAIESITDASASKPYAIHVAPGVYTEDPFTLKQYISIIGLGESYYSVILQTSNNNAHFITGKDYARLENLYILGPSGTGYAAIDQTTISYFPLYLVGCGISGYYGIWCHPSSVIGFVTLFECAFLYAGFTCDKFLYSSGYGRIQALTSTTSGAPPYTVTTSFYCSGYPAQMTLDLCSSSVTGGTSVFADNGAVIRLNACTFTAASKAIHIGSTGTGTLITSVGTTIRSGVTTHIQTDTSSCTVEFSGTMDKNKLSITEGTTFSASFTDSTTNEQGLVVLGELWLGKPGSSIPLRSYTLNTASTGLASNCEITRVSGLQINIPSGVGYIDLETEIKKITWSSTNLTLTADKPDLWVIVNSSGTISETFSSPDNLDVIVLGRAITNADSITFLSSRSVLLSDDVVSKHIYSKEVIGPISVSGCVVTKHASTSVELDVTGGIYYIFDNRKVVDGNEQITFTYWYRDGSGGWIAVPNQTSIDDEHYDNGSGTLVHIPLLQYKRDCLYCVSNGSGVEYHVIYGQETWVLSSSATNNPTPSDEFNNNSLRLAAIIIQDGSGNISSLVDQRPKLGQLASATTSITRHGDLLDLNLDQHTQYQLRSEKNQASGYCGLNASTKIDSTYLSLTNTPPENVTKSAAVIGSSTDLARSDHKHDISTAVPSSVAIGNTQTEGTSTSLARADHLHAVSAGTPVSVGTSNSEGNATTFARSNHVHSGLTRDAGDINSFTAKTTPVSNDLLLIEDSADSNNKKKITIGSLTNSGYTVDLTRTTTTSDTYQDKISLTTAAFTGTIKLSWSCVIDGSNANHLYYVRFYNVTDATVLSEQITRPSNSAEKQGCSGNSIISLSGSAKTFKIQFRSGTAGDTTGCAYAQIDTNKIS